MALLLVACALIGGSVAAATYAVLIGRAVPATPEVVDPVINPVRRRTGDQANLHEVLLARSRTDRVFKPWIRNIRKFIDQITSQRRLGGLAELAATAGIDSFWTPAKIGLARLASLGLGVAAAAYLIGTLGGALGWLAGIIMIGIGWRAFDVFLVNRARHRQEQIMMDLPDIADQVAISAQAGLNFEQAMRRTVDSTTGPLSNEFERFLQDVRVGLTRQQAFKALQERVDVPDVTSFVRAISHAERTGVSIAEILQIQADELREKRRQRAEERAMKLPVLMLIPLVTCVLPPLLILLLGPAAITVWQNGLGL